MGNPPLGIITGGPKGVGAASAVEFASAGAWTILTNRSLDGADDLVGRVQASGAEAICTSADVRDPKLNYQAVQEAVRKWSRIDFLLANAGVADQSQVASGDPERWRSVAETNLLARCSELSFFGLLAPPQPAEGGPPTSRRLISGASSMIVSSSVTSDRSRSTASAT